MVAHKEVVEFIRQYFLDELEGTIDTCAREAAACGVPAGKDIIVRVRRDMKDEIVKLRREREASKGRHAPILSLVKPTALPASDVPVPKDERACSVPIEVRRSYYDDIILSERDITIVKAMKKVTQRYGRSVDVGYALSRLKMVREMYKAEEEPVKHQMNPIKGIEKVELGGADECLVKYKSPAGWTHRIVAANKLKDELSNLMLDGVKPESVMVYDLVKRKVKLTVTIDFE